MSIFPKTIKKIACIGEVMIELVPTGMGQANLGVAGDTFNTAVYLSRLLRYDEKQISYITALGDDPFSKHILLDIEGHGLDVSCIEKRPDRAPGLYAISTSESGERSFTYWRSQSAARTLFSEPCTIKLGMLEEFDLIYLSGITIAILPPAIRVQFFDFLDTFRKKGGLVAFDSNYRERLWEHAETAQRMTDAMWKQTDIALPSLNDEMALFVEGTQQDTIKRFKYYNMQWGALKRGSAGPFDLTGKSPPVAFSKVENITDTTAAGDSFNAGYLAALIQGLTIEHALQSGHDLAAKVIQQQGAIVDV